MSLHPLVGHEAARSGVVRAIARGALPQVLLLHGPPGVGKQRFALWIGQALLCRTPTDAGPCGSCRECGLALRLEHPDLNWYMPVPRPPSKGSRERDDEALEDARRTRLEELRESPLYPSHSSELRALHLGTVRNLRKHARRGPADASRQLFLVADAEELVAQESSPEAANALLKLLEEPPPESWFVLTSSETGRLLPTIRSRATSLHLPPLPAEEVTNFLESRGVADSDTAAEVAHLSGGSIGRALGFLPENGEDGPLEVIRRDAFHLLRAALSPAPGDRFRQALDYPPSGARKLHELLTALEGWLRDLGVVAAGMEERVLNRNGIPWLSRIVREREIHPLYPARAVAAVEEAREQAAGNVNPQLLLAELLRRLSQDLLPATSSRKPSLRG